MDLELQVTDVICESERNYVSEPVIRAEIRGADSDTVLEQLVRSEGADYILDNIEDSEIEE